MQVVLKNSIKKIKGEKRRRLTSIPSFHVHLQNTQPSFVAIGSSLPSCDNTKEMTEDEPDLTTLSCRILLILSLILITGRGISGVPIKTDKEVLRELKLFLQANNRVNQGLYAAWNESAPNPCNWWGITCNSADRVTGISLNDSSISGPMFTNFSQIAELAYLDLSNNTISGPIPPELNQCVGLRYLNLSHNLICGELNLTGLTQLETLDLTLNRFEGSIQSNFPAICTNLVTLNISINNFSGEITGCFDDCRSLKYIDLSSNQFRGEIWQGFSNVQEFSISENHFNGLITAESFPSNCSLEVLDLSANGLNGEFPNSIANCSQLRVLNLWGNYFAGRIPSGIGSLSELDTLFLGNNSFSREIPSELLNCSKLLFIDLSRNKFGGEIQEIFGRFRTVKYLVLHSNSYTRGIESSGILSLPKLARLDLSFNNFSGELPIRISNVSTLQLLILAHNNFNGTIPLEYGNIAGLQALDLSFNKLTGKIPPTIGNLKSLLWLMLGNNEISGEIPPEIGNCSSLLWLNLANNRLTGSIPPSISEIGTNPDPTFETNRRDSDDRVAAGTGECIAMKRWIPASYPPFSFTYTLMTRKNCRSIWDRLLKGYGVFPMCANSTSNVRVLGISGYLQLSGNRISGDISPVIGKMKNLSLLHLDGNRISGLLPPEIGSLPLVVLNVSNNCFHGEIPPAMGGARCLQSLDLSYNNFSGDFTASINALFDLSIFNASYNPLLSGEIPLSGQIVTFGNDSFIGDPLISFSDGNRQESPPAAGSTRHRRDSPRAVAFWVFLALTAAFFLCGFLYFILCLKIRSPVDADPDPDGAFLDGTKHNTDADESSPSTSSGPVKIYRLDKTAFTYPDIVTATGNFSDDMVIGRGGYGVVYRGVLPDGRHVAIKKLQRAGVEGEREFRAEMEILTGRTGSGWPHPNLVVLFGWCLSGSEKLLVYDYMEGGSLDEVVPDWTRFGWQKRLEAAVGVAEALVFLHHECKPAVVHRDVKASNVLLDREGRARVTDFGLARLVGPGESHVSTMVAGTVGYVAPEYGHTCRATTRGDVYSFGVVAMELATGRRAVDGRDECLVEWARRVGIEEVMVVEGMGRMEMVGLMRVGMWCAAEAPQARPDMREVLATLLVMYERSGSEGGGSEFSSSHDSQ